MMDAFILTVLSENNPAKTIFWGSANRQRNPTQEDILAQVATAVNLFCAKKKADSDTDSVKNAHDGRRKPAAVTDAFFR